MKILIVEDNDLYRDIFTIACHDHGNHEIKTAGKLAEADLVRETFTPDAVFSDHSLPDGRGTSRFEAMREQNPKVKICLVTGDLNEPVNHGADYFLKKENLRPGQLKEILTLIEGR